MEKLFNLTIKQRRNELRMSQEKLGFLTGVSQQHIASIEKGEFRTTALGEHTLYNIAKALDCCPLSLVQCQCKYCLDKI